MAVHILRNRRRASTAAATETKVAPAAPAPVAPAPGPTVVERRPRRWRRSRPNPISMMFLAAGWAAALILVLGMLLTWGGANPANTLVDATLDAGSWLATPFHDVFTRPEPDQQLYINWSIAAVVYYLLGRVLSWLTRF
ncbi:hypothetical protein [Actinomadura hibisca]|uniref:hypothetical protein n=1 Tax=Actinomadura hibisca TaxID=68565 RepID=UPI00082C5637|nr:hypothetical protein [Actinomadura hibisca]